MTAKPRITSSILKRKHAYSLLVKLAQTLSEDIAGEFYPEEPSNDDFQLLDEAIVDGLMACLVELDLPEQTRRGEAAMHAASNLDADRRTG